MLPYLYKGLRELIVIFVLNFFRVCIQRGNKSEVFVDLLERLTVLIGSNVSKGPVIIYEGGGGGGKINKKEKFYLSPPPQAIK